MQLSRRCAVVALGAGVAGCFGSSSSPPPATTLADGAASDGAADTSAPEAGPDATIVEGGAATEASTEASTGPSDASGAESSTPVTDAGCITAGDGGTDTFTCTGSMSTARIAPGAALLGNGEVLVAGGWNATSQTLSSAEIYDPVTGTFSPTGSMTDPHLWAGWTAPWPVLTAGPANGAVLTGGGLSASGALLASAELYAPTTGVFSATGSLSIPVIAFDLLALPSGDVLFIGGYSTVTSGAPTPGWMYTAGTDQVQVYDPTTGMFSVTGPLGETRLFGCNVVLPTGDALAIGGWQGTQPSFEQNIEDYDPATGQWSTVGELGDGVTCNDAAFVLPDGTILLDGANTLDPTTWDTTSVDDPPTATSIMFVQLADGDVLAIGGEDSSGTAVATAQRFDANAHAWSAVGSLNQPRNSGRAVRLSSGDVVVVGGSDANGAALATAEIFHP
jgi:hypothetical protein